MLALTLAFAVPASRAGAQTLPAVAGFAGGLVGGAWVTTGVYVFESRATGFVLHSAAELLSPRPEALPVLIMPVAGAIIGYRDRHRLGDAATWGAAGLAAGAIVGAGFGQLIWGTSEGRWAGGTIGSAAGLAIGAIVGALAYRADPAEPPGGATAPAITISIPFGRR